MAPSAQKARQLYIEAMVAEREANRRYQLAVAEMDSMKGAYEAAWRAAVEARSALMAAIHAEAGFVGEW